MNSDAESFVEKYAVSPDEKNERAELHSISGDCQCFGATAENRRPPAMLVFKTKTGEQRALMYSYLVEINFNPSEGIELRFVSHKVLIGGRNLSPIFDRLVQHRVAWIQEINESTTNRAEDATIVGLLRIEGI